MIKHKFAVALGIVVFLVLAGGGVASAYWSTSAQITSTVGVVSLDQACVNPTSVVNASFEEPYLTADITQTGDVGVEVPGWTSAPDGNIEMWVGGRHENVPAPVGRQFVELNGHVAGTLSQVIATEPGQTLQWSLMHRGRWGIDTMEVRIGAAGGAPVPQATISDGEEWTRYSGVYVVPAGQDQTELSFRAVSTSSGDNSVGNFLDDVSFGSGPCLTADSTIANITNPAGEYRPGDVVEYVTTVQNTGSSPSFSSVLSAELPNTLQYLPGTLQVGAASATDSADDDRAEVVGGVLTARLGVGVSGTTGGSIAQGTETIVTLRATVLPNAVGTTVRYAPTVDYVNNLAPEWGLSVKAADVSFDAIAEPVPTIDTMQCSEHGSGDDRRVTCEIGPGAVGDYDVGANVRSGNGWAWESLGTIVSGTDTVTIRSQDVAGMSAGYYNLQILDSDGELLNSSQRIQVLTDRTWSWGGYRYYEYPRLAGNAVASFDCVNMGERSERRVSYIWDLPVATSLVFEADSDERWWNEDWEVIGTAEAGVTSLDITGLHDDTGDPLLEWDDGDYDVRVSSGGTVLADGLQVVVDSGWPNYKYLTCD